MLGESEQIDRFLISSLVFYNNQQEYYTAAPILDLSQLQDSSKAQVDPSHSAPDSNTELQHSES